MSYLKTIAPIKYEGENSTNPLAFRFYDKDRVVLGKRMEDHLRFAACYWHTFCWNGFDVFGYDGSFQRPWHKMADPMEAARAKAEVAFEFFSKLGVPYYCFHDFDVAPEGATPRESTDRLRRMVDVLGEHQQRTGMKVLEKTRNALAVEFRRNAVRLLDDALLFDRALESVIGNLRKLKNA